MSGEINTEFYIFKDKATHELSIWSYDRYNNIEDYKDTLIRNLSLYGLKENVNRKRIKHNHSRSLKEDYEVSSFLKHAADIREGIDSDISDDLAFYTDPEVIAAAKQNCIEHDFYEFYEDEWEMYEEMTPQERMISCRPDNETGEAEEPFLNLFSKVLDNLGYEEIETNSQGYGQVNYAIGKVGDDESYIVIPDSVFTSQSPEALLDERKLTRIISNFIERH